MEVSQSALARMLCCCFLCGLVLGLFYDLLRLTRMPLGSGLPPRAERLAMRLSIPRRLRPFAPRPSQRGNEKRSRVAVFVVSLIEDVFFCLVAAVVLVLVLYATNDGQLRLGAVAMLLLGFVGYLITLGRPMRFCLSVLAVVARAMVVWLFCLVAYPFAALIRLLGAWTAPLRVRLCCFVRCRVRHLREKMKARKQARLMRAAHTKEPALHSSRPPNGRHHFASGTRREKQPPI